MMHTENCVEFYNSSITTEKLERLRFGPAVDLIENDIRAFELYDVVEIVEFEKEEESWDQFVVEKLHK